MLGPHSFSNLVIIYLLTYEDGTECSETSAYKFQTPGNYPEEKNTTYRRRRKFQIKKTSISSASSMLDDATVIKMTHTMYIEYLL